MSGLSRTQTTKNLSSPASASILRESNAKRLDGIFFCVSVFLAQCALILIYALWLDYEQDSSALSNSLRIYGYFRDVNIMIFFGFGFLMTFLRRYGYSAIGYTFLVSALVAQWSVPIQGWFESINEDFHDRYKVGIVQLVNGLFCAGAVMISYGAILGKVTPTQMVIMGIMEPVFYWLNIYVNIMELKEVDVGGGMTIHTFGCYFGLTVCWFLTNRATHHHKDNKSCYSSDLFSYAGTLFLFMMWPSFNAALARDSAGELRALANTFISITASAITSFVISRLVSGWKFDAVHIQNSTLAGGVAMGVAADLNLTVAGAMAAGMSAGIISVLGYHYLTPIISKKFNIQDVCGINNLHGMPGILSCIVGVFGTLNGHTQPTRYGDLFSEYFPQGAKQAGYQTAGIFITIAIAVAGGILTGAVMKLAGRLVEIPHADFFNDRTFWNLPTDYENVIDEEDKAEQQGVKKPVSHVPGDHNVTTPENSDSEDDKVAIEMQEKK